MANRDEIIKRNIAFMYGRNKDEETLDPDKRAVVRTANKYVERDMITNFIGDYDFLQPGFKCHVMLAGDDNIYPSFEHALQASKTTDTTIRSQLRVITDIRELKRMAGRLCTMTESWKEKSPKIAEQLIRDKFFRNKEITGRLMRTEHRTIQYINDFKDLFWGMNAEKAGQNKLGKAIEAVRFSIERGDILDLWVRDHFQLIDPDKVSVTVKARKDGEEIVADREVFTRKPLLEIGKMDENDIITQHPTTSRRHALLVIDKLRGALLIDLHAPNGTFVNGERVSPFTPVRIETVDTVVMFGASRREYLFDIDTSADETRREEIYKRMTEPETGKDTAEDTTVFIGNLPFDCTEQQVREVFESCGSLRSVTVPKDRTGGAGGEGMGRGIAFVTFENVKGLQQALTRDGDDIGGRMIKVKRSEAKSRPIGAVAPENARSQRHHQKRSVNHDDGKDSYYKPRPAVEESSRSVDDGNYGSGREGRSSRIVDDDDRTHRQNVLRSTNRSRSSSIRRQRMDADDRRGGGRKKNSESHRGRNLSSASSSPSPRRRDKRRGDRDRSRSPKRHRGQDYSMRGHINHGETGHHRRPMRSSREEDRLKRKSRRDSSASRSRSSSRGGI